MAEKGSKGCILTLVNSDSYCDEINKLLKSSFSEVGLELEVKIAEDDVYFPNKENGGKEVELKTFLRKTSFSALAPKIADEVSEWWFGVGGKSFRTPNWDLISECKIGGEDGILLVEVKAHVGELHKAGKKLKKDASDTSRRNHEQIGKAIEMAKVGITHSYGKVDISIDKCYQLSNRVAHAWWLASKSIPVVLMYLGFLNVADMDDGKNKIFTNDDDWQKCFAKQAKIVGVDKLIGQEVNCGDGKFALISCSCDSARL
ncbi:hypothetical protein EYV94_08050 [Puteibacter caeruleilacunae]|nr:hypothetical protein EYV94_08050 [Puteibacter caeruleilacunae]